MGLVREYLGYNRFGLRWVTAHEIKEMKRRVLSHNFSPQADIQQSHQKAGNTSPLPGQAVAHQAKSVFYNEIITHQKD